MFAVSRSDQHDIAVIGGGLSGLTAALLFSQGGFKTLLVAPQRAPDRRTTALLHPAIGLLKKIDIHPEQLTEAALLSQIRIIDRGGHLLQMPEATFNANDIGLDAFGYNVRNDILLEALHAQITSHKRLQLHPSPLEKLLDCGNYLQLHMADGSQFRTKLAVGADGSNSKLRELSGIAVRRWSHHHSAFVSVVTHQHPHHDQSVEFHRRCGLVTLVPLGERNSAIIYTDERARIAQLMKLETRSLKQEIEYVTESVFGKILQVKQAAMHPLGGLVAEYFAKRRVILIGEAAHVFPPIGAQGLNLGFRDIAALYELLIETQAHGDDIGAPKLMEKFQSERAPDIWTRTVLVDSLYRSLVGAFKPLSLVRRCGIFLSSEFPPLRRALIYEGLWPLLSRPALMNKPKE